MFFHIGNGNHSRQRFLKLACEKLEDRSLLAGLGDSSIYPNNGPSSASVVADPLHPGGNILLVRGTSGNDFILVEPFGVNKTRVLVNAPIGVFSSPTFQRIVVIGEAGNDNVVIQASISKPSELYGEAGNDALYGAKGADALYGGDQNDRLYGGIGNDTVCGGLGNDQVFGDGGNDLVLGEDGSDQLYGGAGRDILIGGMGGDTLRGETHDDILVDSFTLYDTDASALAAIMSEWGNTTHSYATRVNNIRTGGGSTGGNFLTGSTIADDTAPDTLWGGSEQDWFFRGAGDVLKDRATNESVN